MYKQASNSTNNPIFCPLSPCNKDTNLQTLNKIFFLFIDSYAV